MEKKIDLQSEDQVYKPEDRHNQDSVSFTSQTPSNQPPTPSLLSPPPDGGLQAWSQVLAAHLVAWSAAGFTNAFGFFQAYYTDDFEVSPSSIAWVGSFSSFIVLFFGAYAGRAVDAGHYRTLAITGLALQILGVFMTSLVRSYWQLFLAFGVCQGIGSGLILTPVMVVVATYFTTKRAVAMCCASSGSAIGGIVFPLIAQQLVPRLGVGWAIRVMGFVCLANAAIVLVIVKPRNLPRKEGPVVAIDSFRDVWFSVFGVAVFSVMLGIYFPFYYISSFAENELGLPTHVSLSMLLVLNALGVPGRIVPAYLSDQYVGPQNMLIITSILTGVMVYVWSAVKTEAGLWAFAIVFGFVAANIQSLIAPALASAGRDPTKIGAEMGMLFTIMSFGLLGGPPIAGALITHGNGRYVYAQAFAGSVIVLGAILLLVARTLCIGWKWKKC